MNKLNIELAKYNKSNVMTIAWQLVKRLGFTLSEAIKEAWVKEKSRAYKVYSKLSLEEKSIINGNKKIKKTTWIPTDEQKQALINWYK